MALTISEKIKRAKMKTIKSLLRDKNWSTSTLEIFDTVIDRFTEYYGIIEEKNYVVQREEKKEKTIKETRIILGSNSKNEK